MHSMAFKILIATRSFGSTSSRPWEILAAAGMETVKADMGQPMSEQRLIDLLAGIDGAIVGVVPFTEKVLSHAPQLRVISMHGVGVDHIDLKAAAARGVIVANCPGTNDQGVADLAIGLMICLTREIPVVDGEVRTHEWKAHRGTELWRKTIGLVGLGHIGSAVARRAHGFEMRVLAYDPFVGVERAAEAGVELTTLASLLAQSDFVSLHAPLTPDTQLLIGAEELAQMRPTAYLINTARGGLVDEEALFAALSQGRIAGAGLDAFVQEPPWGSPLLTLRNVVVTPHIGAHTREAIERVGVMAAHNIVRTLCTGEPVHRVV